MAASIAPELDALQAALDAAKAKIAADATTIAGLNTQVTTLQGQVLDPTEATRLAALVAEAQGLVPATPAAPPAN